MSTEPRDKTVYEPEVLPPEPGFRPGRPGPEDQWRAWKRTFGPVVLGLLVDALDFATFGPVGLRMGFLLGGLATFLICSLYNLPFRYRLGCALAAGVYCSLPMTERFPLATLLGIFARLSPR